MFWEIHHALPSTCFGRFTMRHQEHVLGDSPCVTINMFWEIHHASSSTCFGRFTMRHHQHVSPCVTINMFHHASPSTCVTMRHHQHVLGDLTDSLLRAFNVTSIFLENSLPYLTLFLLSSCRFFFIRSGQKLNLT